ncbi:MAG: tyrosine-type recombinase/integrase [Gammaproteobacteria bacterium]|jgi:integrase|nr:tyrosine-type recombinase/integrase [Gammaproteobacteria bacterium]
MSGSITKDNNTNKWNFYFRGDLNCETGKRKEIRRRGFDTKKDAFTAMIKLQEHMSRGLMSEADKMPVLELFSEFIKAKTPEVTSNTLRTYKQQIERIKASFNGLLLKDLRKDHVKSMLNALTEKGYSKLTQKKDYRLLFQAVKWGVDNDLVIKNEVAKVKCPKAESKTIDVLFPEQQAKLIQHLKLEKNGDNNIKRLEGEFLVEFNYMFITFALATGMNRAEVCGLKWDDINFDKKLISVSRNLVKVGKDIIEKETKTSARVRGINVGEETIRDLKKWQSFLSKEKLRLGKFFKQSQFVFPANDGSLLDPNVPSGRVINVSKRAGTPTAIHTLRHTHISNLLNNGVNIFLVSKRAGHSNISTTVDVYGHLFTSVDDDLIQQLETKIRASWN